MPKEPFPLEIKKRALELYLQGYSPAVIAHMLGEEFGRPCKPSTVSSWERLESWKLLKADVQIKAIAEVITPAKERLVKWMQDRASTYQQITEKAEEEFTDLSFKKAIDAVKAMDIGIQGERKILAGLIQIDFLRKVVEIIRKEVQDENVIKRIAIQFKELAAELE